MALTVDPAKAQLSYRLLDDGGYRGLAKIGSEADWKSAISAMCDALDQDEAVQIEVFNAWKMVRVVCVVMRNT